MLQIFRARPPLTTGQRVNLDLLMRRTIDVIGPAIPESCAIACDLADLSIDSESTESLLRTVRSAVLARFPATDVDVKIQVANDPVDDLASHYAWGGPHSPALIQIAADRLDDPLRTTVELANQYSIHYWHANPRIESDQIFPNLTDLLPICCGLGPLVSDAAFYDSQSSEGGWHRWSMSRCGYYNATEIGYASALLARFRRESNPTWLKRMRLDSRQTAKHALRFFAECDRRQRPILFDADRVPHSTSDPSELTQWMVGDDPAFALAAGLALEKQSARSSRVTAAALSAARGTDCELVPVAIRLLGLAGNSSDEVRQLVEHKIASANHAVSIAALRTASDLGYPITRYRQKITNHFQSFAAGTGSLVGLVAERGAEFESLEPLICQHLAEAVLYRNDDAADSLADCLNRISRHPEIAIEREIHDTDLLPQILERFRAVCD